METHHPKILTGLRGMVNWWLATSSWSTGSLRCSRHWFIWYIISAPTHKFRGCTYILISSKNDYFSPKLTLFLKTLRLFRTCVLFELLLKLLIQMRYLNETNTQVLSVSKGLSISASVSPDAPELWSGGPSGCRDTASPVPPAPCSGGWASRASSRTPQLQILQNREIKHECVHIRSDNHFIKMQLLLKRSALPLKCGL